MHNSPAEREIQRLDQLADHLEQLGDHERAAELRVDAVMLSAAELQRMHALADAHRELHLLHDRMGTAWETLSPSDSYWWFFRNSRQHDAVVIWLRIEQQSRIVILETAKA